MRAIAASERHGGILYHRFSAEQPLTPRILFGHPAKKAMDSTAENKSVESMAIGC